MPTCLFSMSVSLFLPCKYVHLYHFSISNNCASDKPHWPWYCHCAKLYHFSSFHIYALIYYICFFLSDLLHSVWDYGSICISTNDPIPFLFMTEQYSIVGIPGGSVVKNLPAMQETASNAGKVGSILSGEESLEKEMVTHSSILAWEIHGQRSLVGCSPWGHRSQPRLRD